MSGSYWLSFQLSLGIGSLICIWLPGTARQRVRFGRAMLVAAAVIPLLNTWEVVPERWAPPPMMEIIPNSLATSSITHSSAPFTVQYEAARSSYQFIQWLMIGSMTVGVIRFGVQLITLYRLQRYSVLLQRDTSSIYVNANIQSPLSYLGFQGTVVVLDIETAGNEVRKKIAVAHERQHQIHGDLRWVWVMALVDIVAIVNPVWWWWRRRWIEQEEIAVDEALLKQGISPIEYANILLEFVDRAQRNSSLVARFSTSSMLKRRIEMLLGKRTWMPVSSWVGVMGVVMMSSVAVAADGLIKDRSVEMNSIPQLVPHPHSTFPWSDNPQVIEARKQLTQTRSGTAFAHTALQQRESVKDYLRSELIKADLPVELEAVVFVESGYRNFVGNELNVSPEHHGAGFWMFIPSTARQYGLQVDEKLDERRDIVLETEAAIALLSDLYERFGDWKLALAAYNQGDTAVNHAIAREGTRDVWELQRRGALNSYVAQVVAAAWILEEQE